MFRNIEPPRQGARPEVAMISMPTTAAGNCDHSTTGNANAGANPYQQPSDDSVYTNVPHSRAPVGPVGGDDSKDGCYTPGSVYNDTSSNPPEYGYEAIRPNVNRNRVFNNVRNSLMPR